MQQRTLVWENCPKCGTPTPDGVLNCPKCGTTVIATPEAIAASQRTRKSGTSTFAQLIALLFLALIGLGLMAASPVLGFVFFGIIAVIVLLRVLLR